MKVDQNLHSWTLIVIKTAHLIIISLFITCVTVMNNNQSLYHLCHCYEQLIYKKNS